MAHENKVKHVAFIMDGNGRWAKARQLPRHLGHKEGCERIIEIYEACLEKGIEVMSLYAFSLAREYHTKRSSNLLQMIIGR